MQRVFMINIGMLPDSRRHPIKRRMCEKVLANTPGLMDWCATKEHGTLLFFGSLPHAEKALDAMRKSKNPVENKIYYATADFEKKVFSIIDEVEK